MSGLRMPNRPAAPAPHRRHPALRARVAAILVLLYAQPQGWSCSSGRGRSLVWILAWLLLSYQLPAGAQIRLRLRPVIWL
jgi:hypothetical protein